MAAIPDTRDSLIVRLRDLDDELAWEEFVGIYRPVIVRVAMLKGLQPSDAEDLAQQVLLSVSAKIPAWEHDPNRARFRTWLSRVVRNAIINALTRRATDRGIGGTTAAEMLRDQPFERQDSERIETEWRREAFRWAADQIRDQFHSATWEAFWLTAVEGHSAEEAARRTGKTVGAVYTARSRVMSRLQQVVRELEGEPHGETIVKESRHD